MTNASGQVIAPHDFLPFGEKLTPQNEPPDKRLYTGQERDFETGQDYVGARQLRTDLGRFLAPDPMTLVPRVVGSQGVNSYAYVRNNPLTLIDPNGLAEVEPWDEEPLDLYAAGDWEGDPGSDFSTQGSLDDTTQSAPDPPGTPSQDVVDASGGPGSPGPTKPEEAPSSSWKPGDPLPQDPGGLGPNWQRNPEHKAPNGEQWANDKTGGKLDFDRRQPGKPGEKGKDHWHYTPPGGEKGRDHIRPGTTGNLLQRIGDGIVQTVKEHPVATGVVVGGTVILASVSTGGAAAAVLVVIFP